MKKIIIFTLLLLILTACKSNTQSNPVLNLKTTDDLAEKRVGIKGAAVTSQILASKIANPKIVPVDNFEVGINALKNNEIDLYADELPILKSFAAKNKDFAVLDIRLTLDEYALGMKPGDTALKNTIDSVINELRANTKLDDMEKRWFENGDVSTSEIDKIKLSGENGVLSLGICQKEPFAFTNNGIITGFDIEFAKRVALKLGKTLQINTYSKDELLSALKNGDVDIIGGGLFTSDYPLEDVLFSKRIYRGGIYLISKK